MLSQPKRTTDTDLIGRMALDLIRLGATATASEREAIRALAAKGGYRMGDVAALAEDALMVARRDAPRRTVAIPRA